MSAEKSDVTAFTKWLEKNHSEEMDDFFLVYQKNKKITAQDIYDSFGAISCSSCFFCSAANFFFLATLTAKAASAMIMHNKKQLEQEIAQMNESLNDCYNTFLTDNGMSAL